MLAKILLKEYVYAAVGLTIATALAVVLSRNYLPPTLPILYGRPTGESQLVPNLGLLIVPSVSILIIIINSVISVFSKDIFLKKVLAVSSLLVAILTAIAVAKVIFLVGFF